MDLFPKTGCRTYKEITHEIYFSDKVGELVNAHVERATSHRAWGAISHDATYKAITPTIGQSRNGSSSSSPIDIHARHTVREKQGCVRGIIPLFPDGGDRTFMAIERVLATQARSPWKFLFTDNAIDAVGTIVSDIALRACILPALSGIGEGPTHLVYRRANCVGQRGI